MATNLAGDVLVNDIGNDRIRLVAGQARAIFGKNVVAGHIYTLLSLSKTGINGRTFRCANLSIRHGEVMPCSVAFDPAGNAVLATTDLVEVLAVRTGTFYRRHMIAGHLYAIAGGGKSTADGTLASQARIAPNGLAIDRRGDIVIGSHVIAEASGTLFGKRMTAGHVYSLPAVRKLDRVQAIDAHGNALLTNNVLVKVLADTSGIFYGRPMVAGRVYTVAGDGIFITSGDGGPALDAGVQPGSVAVDGSGNLIIGDAATVRAVAAVSGTFYGQAMTAGDIYTIAGGGASSENYIPALDAVFGSALHVAVAPGGAILVSDQGTREVRQLS